MRFVPHQNLSWAPSICIYSILVPLRENLSDLPMHLNVHTPTLSIFRGNVSIWGQKTRTFVLFVLWKISRFSGRAQTTPGFPSVLQLSAVTLG